MLPTIAVVDELICQAQSGSAQAVEKLLSTYRDYLRHLASKRLGSRLAGRVSPSDLVQETMLAAWSEFNQFRGDNAQQFSLWLRTILLRKVSAAVDVHIHAAKRNAQRERRIAPQAGSSILLADFLAAKDRSPSSILSGAEDASRIHEVLAMLPNEYQQVIQWRNFDGVQFNEIAQRLGKTSGATRLVWLRAIRTLKELYEADQL